MQGRQCLKCGYDVVSESKTKSEDTYLKELQVSWWLLYDYSLVNYSSAHGKITIVCPEHGSFTQQLIHIWEEEGVLPCSKEGLILIKETFYTYLKVTANTQETLYKIGITNSKRKVFCKGLTENRSVKF